MLAVVGEDLDGGLVPDYVYLLPGPAGGHENRQLSTLTCPFALTFSVAFPTAVCRASGALLRTVSVAWTGGAWVLGALVLGVGLRIDGGICGMRGSGVGSGAGSVAAHASAGVWPSSAWWARSWL